MGEKTGNKLIRYFKIWIWCKLWRKRKAKVEMLQNSDGGLAAQMK